MLDYYRINKIKPTTIWQTQLIPAEKSGKTRIEKLVVIYYLTQRTIGWQKSTKAINIVQLIGPALDEDILYKNSKCHRS